MENTKEELLKEYYKRFNTTYFWNAKIAAYDRFSVRNNRIEAKSLPAILYTIFTSILCSMCNMYMSFKLYIEREYLYLNEVLILLQFVLFHFCFMFNIILNRFIAAQMIYNNADIDISLGVNETKPLRDIQFTVFKFFHYFVSLGASAVLLQIHIIAYTFVTIDVYVAGLLSLYTVFQIYYDLIFFLSLYFNIIFRVRYLNTALMRIVQVKSEYVPDLLGQKMFWKTKYNQYFEASKNVGPEKIIPTFKSIFYQVRLIEKVYRFTIQLFMTSIPLGTFFAVSSFITYVQTGTMALNRLIFVLSWGVSSWGFILFMSINIDLFTQQIEQTNLICTYTQLKPTSTDEAFKLTKHIIRMLAVRDPRLSIYDMYYFDTGLVFRIAASIFVYVTAQIQLSLFSKDYMPNFTNSTFN